MDAEFRHLDGACAGQVLAVRREFATLGRHPSADLRFDAAAPDRMSGRHAAVFRQGEGWAIRDLGSSAGTFVNGTRLRGDHRLGEHDIVQLGPGGPRLEFRTRPDDAGAAPTPGNAAPPAPRAVTPPRTAAAAPRRATAAPAVRAVPRESWVLRRAVMTLAIVALAAAAVAGWGEVSRWRAVQAGRTLLLARSDSLRAALDAVPDGADPLAGALDGARREAAALRDAIGRAGTRTGLDSLGTTLESRARAQRAVLAATGLDAAAIAEAARGAVLEIVSDFAGGARRAGSGFVVERQGDIAWVVTCRHLVTDSAGRPAARSGALLEGEPGSRRATLAWTSDTADLALLVFRLPAGGPVLRVAGAGPALGEAVLVLGLPPGLEPPAAGDRRASAVAPAHFAATVRTATGDGLELDGYGREGSSGSAVLNAAGEVVGVVAGPGGRSLPAGALAALLARIPGRPGAPAGPGGT